MIKENFIKHFVNPYVWRYIKCSKRFEYLKKVKSQQWDSIDKNRKRQARKLFDIIRYSESEILYYKELINDNNIKYSKDTIFNDIKKFPILTKEKIKNNFEKLVNKNIKSTKNTSGGSTGEPITLLQTKYMYDRDASVTNLFHEWTGYEQGDLIVKLWGSERDIIKGNQGIQGLLLKMFMNEVLLNTFKMSEDDINNFIDIINTKKPKLIISYVQSAYEIARYLSKNKIKIYKPAGIITSAGTLFPDFKKLIQSSFQCKVFNFYGSREIGPIACECDKHEGMHLNIFNKFYEILNNNLETVTEDGSSGELYITLLDNYAMPLIRYKIGDIATVCNNEQCSCGRGLPIIKHITGRTVNVFKSDNGNLIDGEYFTHLFYFIDWVDKFQVVQEDYNFITIKVVIQRSNSKNEIDIKKINEGIRKVMGSGCRINWEFLSEIRPTKSGKYVYTISKLDE